MSHSIDYASAFYSKVVYAMEVEPFMGIQPIP